MRDPRAKSGWRPSASPGVSVALAVGLVGALAVGVLWSGLAHLSLRVGLVLGAVLLLWVLRLRAASEGMDRLTPAIRERFERLSATATIGREVLSTADLPEFVRTVLLRLPAMLACRSVGFVVRRSGERTADAHVRPIGADGGREPTSSALDPAALRELRRTFRDVRDVLVLAADDERVARLAHPQPSGVRSLVAFPLFFKRDLVGLLSFWCAAPPAASQLWEVRQLADQVAVALSNVRMLEEIQFFAYYDKLTGLPNRTLCTERLGHALGQARRRDRLVAVLSVDLDHFKRVNDTLGRDRGDDLIREVSQRLSACTRRSDTMARSGEEEELDLSRPGGDEFIAVLEDLADVKDAAHVCRRMLDALAEPFQDGTQEISIGASIGVAVYPHDGDDAETLLRNASAAMYHAKSEGRRDFRFYQEFMNQQASYRLTVESRLRKALEGGALELHYQPLVDARSRRMVGVEALARWTDPELGRIPPSEFIPIAEESGLIVPLGKWILRTACAQAVAWERAGLSRVYMSVNVSPSQFRDRTFVAMVRDVIGEAELDPELLSLEITENLLVHRAEVAPTIDQLKQLGLRLSIDDFGTGFSALGYLKHLPVDCLKIDQTFVRGIGTSPEDEAITSAILALGHTLGLSVVAEGVETEAQLEYLTERGCDTIQGYVFSRPVPPEELSPRLSGGRFD